jgi:acyl-CoA reductase-like NAD-dependent aldehyde dehydrogenase
VGVGRRTLFRCYSSKNDIPWSQVDRDLGSRFGGYKKSGIGREHGPTAYQEFLRYKTMSVDLRHAPA